MLTLADWTVVAILTLGPIAAGALLGWTVEQYLQLRDLRRSVEACSVSSSPPPSSPWRPPPPTPGPSSPQPWT